jgi:hypothetical protein
MITDLAYAYSVKDPNNYLLDNAEAAQQIQASEQAAAQQGAPEKPPIENINYKDAPPDIRAQMEQAAGMQPSAIHEHEAAAIAAQHATTTASIINPELQGGVVPNGSNIQSAPVQAGTGSPTA